MNIKCFLIASLLVASSVSAASEIVAMNERQKGFEYCTESTWDEILEYRIKSRWNKAIEYSKKLNLKDQINFEDVGDDFRAGVITLFWTDKGPRYLATTHISIGEVTDSRFKLTIGGKVKADTLFDSLQQYRTVETFNILPFDSNSLEIVRLRRVTGECSRERGRWGPYVTSYFVEKGWELIDLEEKILIMNMQAQFYTSILGCVTSLLENKDSLEVKKRLMNIMEQFEIEIPNKIVSEFILDALQGQVFNKKDLEVVQYTLWPVTKASEFLLITPLNIKNRLNIKDDAEYEKLVFEDRETLKRALALA